MAYCEDGFHWYKYLYHQMPVKPINTYTAIKYGCNAGAGAYSNSILYPNSYHFEPKTMPFRTQVQSIS